MIVKPMQIKGNFSSALNELRLTMVNMADNRCQGCKRRKSDFHIHHIDGCGLNWDIKNLMLVCSKCHGKVHAGRIKPKPFQYIPVDYVVPYEIGERLKHRIPGLEVKQIAENLILAPIVRT